MVSEGLRSAAVACVGRLYLAVGRVCREAAQGVQALGCRSAAGKRSEKVHFLKEWTSQRMGEKLNGSSIREKYQSKGIGFCL